MKINTMSKFKEVKDNYTREEVDRMQDYLIKIKLFTKNTQKKD